MNTEGKKAQQKEMEKCWSQNYAWKRTANTFVVTDFSAILYKQLLFASVPYCIYHCESSNKHLNI